MAKNQQPRIRAHGDRRSEPDVRRLARAIVRLAVQLDTEQAQHLADSLEHEDAVRRKALTRQRRADNEDIAKESA